MVRDAGLGQAELAADLVDGPGLPQVDQDRATDGIGQRREQGNPRRIQRRVDGFLDLGHSRILLVAVAPDGAKFPHGRGRVKAPHPRTPS